MKSAGMKGLAREINWTSMMTNPLTEWTRAVYTSTQAHMAGTDSVKDYGQSLEDAGADAAAVAEIERNRAIANRIWTEEGKKVEERARAQAREIRNLREELQRHNETILEGIASLGRDTYKEATLHLRTFASEQETAARRTGVAWADSFTRIADLERDADDERSRLTLNSFDFQRVQLGRWFDDQKAAIRARGVNEAPKLQALEALYVAKDDALKVSAADANRAISEGITTTTRHARDAWGSAFSVIERVQHLGIVPAAVGATGRRRSVSCTAQSRPSTVWRRPA